MPSRPYENWTTEALQDYEEELYDDERAGDGDWFIRDLVLWELNLRRSFAHNADETGD